MGCLGSDLEINKFIENPTINSYFKLEKTIRKKINKSMKEKEISDFSNLFMNTVKVYYTFLLPKDYPGRNIYMLCFSELYHFRKSLKKRRRMKKVKNKFKIYKDCIFYQFAEEPPPDFKRLLLALEKIK